mgnify:CR=1 FL=1
MAVVALATVMSMPAAFAGNDSRRGTAGATELLINPWARSAGWGNVSTANARGIDAYFTNIAGLSFIENVEFGYSFSSYLGGKSGLVSGATINSIGLGKSILDNKGVLGFYVMTMNVGDITVTTVDNPDGTQGTYSPSLMNLNVAYAHNFTSSIHGGVNIKVVSESTADISGTGFGIDAGIQYVTGENSELKFGISLKNIGPSFSFNGTGLSLQFAHTFANQVTVEYRAAAMELPTCLNIGVSYDFLFEKWNQRLTFAGNFTSNAFLKDNFVVGAEYSLLDMVQLRGALVYQNNLFSDARTTANSGLTAGASFIIPINKEKGTNISLDYAYRSANPMPGSHSIGATLKF